METKSNIYKKLAAVKAKIGKLTKDTSNPFFKSKYADINQLIEMTDPVLLEAGLLSIQPIEDGHVVTKIVDIDSGETITSSLKLPESNDPQKVGSAITYFRRYSLKALLNIGEEDDDANKAAGNNQNQTANQKQQKANTATAAKASASDQVKQPASKSELYPGLLDKWNAAKDFIKNYNEGSVFDALDSIKKKYTLTDVNEKLLVKEAKGVSVDEEVPQETLDAIKSAKTSEELTNIWNELTALHASKSFIQAWEQRRKEILLPSKDKKAA